MKCCTIQEDIHRPVALFKIAVIPFGTKTKTITHFRDANIKIRCQGDRKNGNIIHLGADLVHAVCWRGNENVVLSRVAKDPHQQINGFIRSHTNKNIQITTNSHHTSRVICIIIMFMVFFYFPSRMH